MSVKLAKGSQETVFDVVASTTEGPLFAMRSGSCLKGTKISQKALKGRVSQIEVESSEQTRARQSVLVERACAQT
jgi:hypothetical protein